MINIQKYKTLIIFLILVAIWGAFFSSMKFFLWGDLEETLKPSLQEIAWYLSLGWIFAYLIWWAFASTFLKKYFLFVISILSFLFIVFAYYIWFWNNYIFWFIISAVWFLYGLWNVVKNVIVAIEIKKTWLPETVINALAGIIFVVFIIIWSLLWNVLFEKMWHEWYFIIMSMLIITAMLWFSLDYDKKTFTSLLKNWWKWYLFWRKNALSQSLKAYIPDLKFIIKNYTLIILWSSLLWTVSTIVSQASVEYSVIKFEIEKTTATYILLYSALWAIIWNIVSMKMNTARWKFYIIFNSLFALLIILFPFLAVSFSTLSILAVFLWLFFWVSSNLVDSYLLKRIWEEDKKEYGSSTYWLVLSIMIFVMMFTSAFILDNFWYTLLMFILWVIMVIMWFLLYKKQTISNKKYL